MIEIVHRSIIRLGGLVAGISLVALLISVPALALTLASQTTWGGFDSEVTNGSAVGSDDSVFLTGFTRSFSGSQGRPITFLVRFAGDGSVVWDRTWQSPATIGSDEARDVDTSPDGSVYVTGSTPGTAGDVFLLKFDSRGSLVWQRSWGGNGSEAGEGVSVSADGATIYVTGSTSSFGAGAGDIFVLKFDPDGNLLSQKTWGTSGGEFGDDVVVAADGSVFVTGTAPRPGDVIGSDIVLLKLDPADNLIWQRAFAAGEIVDPRGGLAIAPDGSIYVAGTLQEVTNSGVIVDALLLKFSADGSLLWDRGWGGRSGEEAGGVSVRTDGTVFLVGSTASFGVAPDDAFIVQFLPSGRAMDAMTWGGAGLDKGNGVSLGLGGTIFLAGTAEAPPYSFLRASTRTTRLRGVTRTPAVALSDAAGNLVDPGGTVNTPNGSTTFAGGFDAALIRVLP